MGTEHVKALGTMLASVPLTEEQLLLVEELIKTCSQTELIAMGLGPPPKPAMPAAKVLVKMPPPARLQSIQKIISSLQYNHTPGYMFNVCKDRPYSSIMNTARDVLRHALPIKCIEGVFLGMLLTCSWPDLERLPVGFKSMCQGNTYRHIVLAVHHMPSGSWGALGISRRPELQYKELIAPSLAELMADYTASYEQWGHTLHKIRVGLPVEHDADSMGRVCWRYCCLSCSRHPWTRCATILNAFADNARRLAQQFRMLGVKPPNRRGTDATGNSHGKRVPLSGTTPEPGAFRPSLAATATLQPSTSSNRRHSLSPCRQPSCKRMTSEKKTTAAGMPPKPATRKGSVSAPPRPRPGKEGPASGPLHSSTNPHSNITAMDHQLTGAAKDQVAHATACLHTSPEVLCLPAASDAGVPSVNLPRTWHDTSILDNLGQLQRVQGGPAGKAITPSLHGRDDPVRRSSNGSTHVQVMPLESEVELQVGDGMDEQLASDSSDDSEADENDT